MALHGTPGAQGGQPRVIPFGKYMLLRRIAIGGMAEVFLGKSFGAQGFQKFVAIKRILPTMVEDEDFIEMFIDEARIAGHLHQANIVPIYELGKVGESHYIAMEYVWGRDLLQIMNRYRRLKQRMPADMVAYIAAKMCKALDYAHRKSDPKGQPLNLIHRDVSPQNVLVTYDGVVKLIDFGIAKAASRSTKTQAGVLKGKFGYMSPEQVLGKQIDGRSDIFAVGTCMYEMLMADRLFLGESDFTTLENVREADVEAPSVVVPGVPEEFDRIVLKSLARDPDDRYQSAGELHDDLAEFLEKQTPSFSGPKLGAWMKTAFAPEMQKERAMLDGYAKLQPPRMAKDAPAAPPKPKRRPAPAPSPASARLPNLISREGNAASADVPAPTPAPAKPKRAPVPPTAKAKRPEKPEMPKRAEVPLPPPAVQPPPPAGKLFDLDEDDDEPTELFDNTGEIALHAAKLAAAQKAASAAPPPPSTESAPPEQNLFGPSSSVFDDFDDSTDGSIPLEELDDELQEEPTQIFFSIEEIEEIPSVFQPGGSGDVSNFTDEVATGPVGNMPPSWGAPPPAPAPIASPAPAPAPSPIPSFGGPAPAPVPNAHDAFRPIESDQSQSQRRVATMQLRSLEDTDFKKQRRKLPLIPIAAGVAVLLVLIALVVVFSGEDPARLEVSTEPDGATIKVDGEEKGKSPLNIELPAGKHKLEISSAGYELAEKDVDLQEGASSSFSITMKKIVVEPVVPPPVQPEEVVEEEEEEEETPQTKKGRKRKPRRKVKTKAAKGSLVINTMPWARVYIDGRDTRRNTPIKSMSISAGRHVIGLRTSDGKMHRVTAVVEPGQTVRITRRLK